MALRPSRVIESLQARYLLSNHTKMAADTAHDKGSSVYCGFDPTANDLHVGNLLTVLGLAHFQLEGYQPIAVVGGATAVIGDPSGHNSDRQSIAHDTINDNIRGITNTLTNIFNNVTSSLRQRTNRELLPLKILNNASWYRGVSVVDFMSDIGKHFRMTSMMNKDSVQSRLNSIEGINYTEFSYQVFQAYDYLHLHKNHHCWLQVGGGDQWGNITAGCSLVRKYLQHDSMHVHGVTMPLVTTATGDKLSKSLGNTIMLSSSPYHIYQYFYNTPDNIVERFLHYFTFATTEEIADIMEQHRVNPEASSAQKYLAMSVTTLLYGDEGYQQAMSATSALFGGHEILQLSHDTLVTLFADAPHHTLSLDHYTNNSITDIFVDIGAIKKGDVSNLLKLGALYINNIKICRGDILSIDKHILSGNVTIIRRGKKHHYLIKWT